METAEIIDAIHEHLDQAFDKVVVREMETYDLEITATKNGKTRTIEVDEADFEPEDDEDIYEPEAYREHINTILDNLKYELLKNL